MWQVYLTVGTKYLIFYEIKNTLLQIYILNLKSAHKSNMVINQIIYKSLKNDRP